MSDSAREAVCAAIERRIGSVLDLPATGAWPATRHLLDEPGARAIIAALAAERPLLLRGEPGVGKSQLARAAAELLGRPFLATVIQPDSEYQELLWAMDHTARLADAQLDERQRVREVQNYIGPGALWWALSWNSAAAQAKQCRFNFNPPDDLDGKAVQERGCVLLIDEIDKADIALTNGLLEVLGNRRFGVPSLGLSVRAEHHPAPLVVLTSNDSRQLPPALLRRCVVQVLELAEPLHDTLVERGRTHFPGMDAEVLSRAAEQIIDDRAQCSATARTGLAEYLDLLRALKALAEHAPAQLDWLDKLGGYFSKRHAG